MFLGQMRGAKCRKEIYKKQTKKQLQAAKAWGTGSLSRSTALYNIKSRYKLNPI